MATRLPQGGRITAATGDHHRAENPRVLGVLHRADVNYSVAGDAVPAIPLEPRHSVRLRPAHADWDRALSVLLSALHRTGDGSPVPGCDHGDAAATRLEIPPPKGGTGVGAHDSAVDHWEHSMADLRRHGERGHQGAPDSSSARPTGGKTAG